MTEATAEETAPSDPATELEAMGEIARSLGGLDPDTRRRVLQWTNDRYAFVPKAGSARPASGVGVNSTTTLNGNGSATSERPQFADLAELFAATNPQSDADKTLVGAYWAQFGEGKTELSAFDINTALKNLGHPIGNITNAFTGLKERVPAVVLQVKKSGSSKQARKTYRVTVAGKSAVESMIGQGL